MHQRCPRAWGYRYLEQLPETAPDTGRSRAAARGKLLHAALEQALVECGEQGRLEDLVLSEQDLRVGVAGAVSRARQDELEHASDVEAVLVGLAPLEVGTPERDPEHRWKLDLGRGVELRGVFDLVVARGDELRVLDWKSGQIPHGDPAWNPQVLAYLVAARELFRRTEPPVVELIYLEQGTRVLTTWTPALDARGRSLLHASAASQVRDWARWDREGKPPRARPGAVCASCGWRDRCEPGAAWLDGVVVSQDQGLGDADLLARRRALAGAAALADRRRHDLDEEIRRRLGPAQRLEAGGLRASVRSRRSSRLPIAAVLELPAEARDRILTATVRDVTLARAVAAAPELDLASQARETVTTYLDVRVM